MLFEGGTGFCPWHMADSSFRIVETVQYAGPTYYSFHGAGPRNVFDHDKEINRPSRTGVVVMECMHCKKTIILLEKEVRLPPEEPGGDQESKTWRWMVSPAEPPGAFTNPHRRACGDSSRRRVFARRRRRSARQV